MDEFGAPHPTPGFPESSTKKPPHQTLWREALPIVVVAVVAAGFRLYQLSSAPPGLHHDEAVNGLDILFNIPTSHPIFFEANYGREPLFIYLQAAAVYLLGPTVLALRLTSAIVGICTVLATYWLAHAWFGRRVALLAGLGLATSFWHVDLSRVGLRAIAAPLFLTLAITLLWYGLRRGRISSFAFAGIAIGLDLYTYLSSRLAPGLIGCIIIWEAVRNWRHLWRRRVGLLVFAGMTIVVLAPLGAYFVTHPDSFIGRAGQVSIFNPNPTIEGRATTLRDSLVDTLGMFFVRGDENARHNLPNRPVFDPISAPWLLVGLGVALWRAIVALRRRSSGQFQGALADTHPIAEVERGWPRVNAAAGSSSRLPWPLEPSGWLLLWLPLTLAPGVFAHESPNFLRLTAAAPAVYIIWGLGLATAWESVARRLVGIARPAPAPALAGILALTLVGYEATRTYRDYFHDWADRVDVYQAFDSGLTPGAEYVQASATDETGLFFYVDRSPPLLYLSPSSRRGRWLNEFSNLLLLPSSTRDAIYLFAGDGVLSSGPQLYFPKMHPDGLEVGPDGRPGFTAYRLTTDHIARLSTPAVRVNQPFDGTEGQVELVGYTFDSTIARPGESLGVTLLWRQRAAADVVYAPYIHFVDETERSWGQDDRLGKAVGGWQTGDLFLSRHVWSVPPDAPPMTYRVRAGMATRASGPPPGQPEPLGSAIDLAEIRIEEPNVLTKGSPMPGIANELHADVGAHLELLGYDVTAASLKPGEALAVDLLWHARQAPERDVLIKLALLNDSGQPLVEESMRPVYDQQATSRWKAGTVLRDPRTLTVPPDTHGGSLRLLVQTVDAVTGEQLGQAALGSVEVAVPPRTFDLPPMEEQFDANFGGEIALRGFDIDLGAIDRSRTLRLTLYWQALSAPSRNYTVFTHVLDGANQIVAQQDNPPMSGTLPTLGWAPRQVVRDEYELKLPPDSTPEELRLEVGLYDPTTGERLRLVGKQADHVTLTRVQGDG